MIPFGGGRNLALFSWLLVAAFAGRVVAQPLPLLVDAGFLPDVNDWHAGVPAYPVLLSFQLLVLAALVRVACGFAVGRVRLQRHLATPLLIACSVYFAGMGAGGLHGLTVFSEVRCFASPLPTLFHLLLAMLSIMEGMPSS